MSILLIVPLYVCPVYLIQSSKYVVLVLFAKYGLPSFMTGIVLFGFSKLIYTKFALLQPEIFKSYTAHINEGGNDEDLQSERVMKRKVELTFTSRFLKGLICFQSTVI